MGLVPQNKGIVLVALGACMIISILMGDNIMADKIFLVFVALVNPGE